MGVGRSQITKIIGSDNYYTTGGTLGGDDILTGSLANTGATWTADLSALAGGGSVATLNDIGNVNITGIAAGEVIKWDSVTSKWVNDANTAVAPGSAGNFLYNDGSGIGAVSNVNWDNTNINMYVDTNLFVSGSLYCAGTSAAFVTSGQTMMKNSAGTIVFWKAAGIGTDIGMGPG